MARWLVTGLPRTRTAWFAVVGHGMHEPISHSSYDAFGALWVRHEIGVSDAGAALWLPEILDDFAPKVLIVERSVSDVLASLRTYLGDRIAMDWAAVREHLVRCEKALAACNHPLVKRVGFDQLADIETMAASLDWLGLAPPNLPQLMRMHIESDLAWNLTALRERT